MGKEDKCPGPGKNWGSITLFLATGRGGLRSQFVLWSGSAVGFPGHTLPWCSLIYGAEYYRS